MKAVGFVGSPREQGSTQKIVQQILLGAADAGADIKLYNINSLNIRGCQGCMSCRKNNTCVLQDDMQLIYKEIISADLIVIGSPVYLFGVTSQTKMFIDRLFPFLNYNFSSNLRKRTVIVYTQGDENKDAFKGSLDLTTSALALLGFRAKKVLIEGNLDDRSDISLNVELMEKAKNIGIEMMKSKRQLHGNKS